MALRDLIEHTQQNLVSPRGMPDPDRAPSPSNSQRFPDEPNAPVGRRPPVPPWVTNGTANQVLPFSQDDSVVIEEPIDPLTFPENAIPRQDSPADSLAYYLPFHFYLDEWGIYVRGSGLVSLAWILKGAPLTSADKLLLELSRSLLLAHETFHFISEVACSRGEFTAKTYLYEHYFNHPYGAPHEEALANAHAYRSALRRQSPAVKAAVSEWMERQGLGYRGFKRWLGLRSFENGCSRASTYMTEPIPDSLPVPASPPREFLFAGATRYPIPTRFVVDIPLPGLDVLKPFPKYLGMRVLVHTREHPPPHIHIEIPPGREVTKYAWPGLQPLPRETQLSANQKDTLKQYVDRYRDEIAHKVEQVFR